MTRCVAATAALELLAGKVWAQTALPAFPGAEGYGSCTPGGRGGAILFVTNLLDYIPGRETPIPGSLRAACGTPGRRTVVFRVSGTIALKQTLTITEAYLTLAGQTAPGDGICVRNYGTLLLNTHDIIVRHLRFRPGDEVGRRLATDSGGSWQTDALSAHGCRDVIFDHCSASWANDEVLSLTECDNVTVQWCFITESLNRSTHEKGAHGFGGLIAYMRDGARISQHHNLWAFHRGRSPRPGCVPTPGGEGLLYDFRNNVVYQGGRGYSSEDDNVRMNYIGNHVLKSTPFSATPGVRIFQAGNLLDDAEIEWSMFEQWARPKGSFQRMEQPFAVAQVTTHSAAEAERLVLKQAGAVLPRRDAVDERVVESVRKGAGRLIDGPESVGGWPVLVSLEPQSDGDNDGMSDKWEKKHGLQPGSPDNNGDADNDGYTNLEEFLNDTAPKRAEAIPARAKGGESPNAPARNRQVVFGCATADLAEFRAFAQRAKALGATHVTITAEDLPLAHWELDPPGDPYPAWVITNPGLLKIATQNLLKPNIPQAHGQEVMQILESRCRILRELGLKAAFHTFEPQMLPERVFTDHPDWRGPRVDHPERSRTPRHAPCISHPEVLKLYSEAMNILLEKCPAIEILQMRTSDSGSGICWSPSLYAGANGNPACQSQDMPARVRGFLQALRSPAAERNAELHLNLFNLRDRKNAQIASALEPGMAIDDEEGPDGRPFKFDVGELNSGISLLYYRRPFAPACGIPWPKTFLSQLSNVAHRPSKRLFVPIGDRHNLDLYLRIYQEFCRQPATNAAASQELLRRVAAEQVGPTNANRLLEIWSPLKAVEDRHRDLGMGGSLFILGGVHERWITRPLVPFPERLTPAEREWWRPFQFQAGTEAEANDLMNLQGRRVPDAKGGYDRLESNLADMRFQLARATTELDALIPSLTGSNAASYRLLGQRLEMFRCLLDNATHVVAYQRLLDSLGNNDKNIADGSRIARYESLNRIADEEVANARRMLALLDSEGEFPLLDRAQTGQREYQRLLAHNVSDQLRRKIAVMLLHRAPAAQNTNNQSK